MGLERGRTEGNRQQQYAENPEAAGQAMCHRYHRSLSSTRSLRWRDFSEAERQGAADPLCRREALEHSAPAPGFLLQGALVVVDVLPAVAEPNVRNEVGSRLSPEGGERTLTVRVIPALRAPIARATYLPKQDEKPQL